MVLVTVLVWLFSGFSFRILFTGPVSIVGCLPRCEKVAQQML